MYAEKAQFSISAFLFSACSQEATENARLGKCKIWKMTDQIARLENAGPKNVTSC